MKNVFVEADRRLAQLTSAIAVAMFILIPILTTYQILARFVLNDPASWTEASVRLVMIWSAFLGLSLLMRQGLMISMDFLTRRVSGGYEVAFSVIQIVAILIVLGTALYGGIKLLSIIKAQRVAGLGISMAWVYAAVPFGAGLGILTVISKLLANNAKVEDPDSEQALTVSQT